MDPDLNELYQSIILDHNKRPRHYGRLEPCTHEAEGTNPLCGDQIEVRVTVEDGRIADVAFEAAGCAISKASASIMTGEVIGQPVDAIEGLLERVGHLVGDESAPDADLAVDGDMAALAGVRKFPARIKCATLPWHTLRAALRGEGRVEA